MAKGQFMCGQVAMVAARGIIVTVMVIQPAFILCLSGMIVIE